MRASGLSGRLPLILKRCRMRHVTDEERRARLAVRHALVPIARVAAPEAVTQAMTVLHATEAASVYLSYWARSRSPRRAELDRALYEDRSLVKQLAMRRTLFVFPRDLLPAAWGSASARVARAEASRIAKNVAKSGLAPDGDKWLRQTSAGVLSVLANYPEGISALELRKLLPELTAKMNTSATAPGTITQLLTCLGAQGDIVRTTNKGSWHTSQPRWTTMRHWLGETPKPYKAADGYRELVARWLRTFGPGTESDIVWWLGAAKSAVRAALKELGAVEVSLDSGAHRWLLPDDLNEEGDPGRWVALLPSLDPTVMGWQERNFYLGSHRNELFDVQGNAGTTVWVNGRVVGYWVQDGAGAVQLRLLEKVSGPARRELESEAMRLTEWLGGVRPFTVLGKRP